jgi:hypothetical protein
VSRALRRAAMERMEASAARLQPLPPILTIPARTLAGTHYVPTLLLGPYSLRGCDPADALRDWIEEPEAIWTSYPAVR